MRTCSIDGCENKHTSKGWCLKHYMRNYRQGDPNKVLFDRAKPGSGTVKYVTAHARCRKLWGSASAHECVDCGNQANDWSYDGTDPDPLGEVISTKQRGSVEVEFSAWPEFYAPRCRPCHQSFDLRGKVRV